MGQQNVDARISTSWHHWDTELAHIGCRWVGWLCDSGVSWAAWGAGLCGEEVAAQLCLHPCTVYMHLPTPTYPLLPSPSHLPAYSYLPTHPSLPAS